MGLQLGNGSYGSVVAGTYCQKGVIINVAVKLMTKRRGTNGFASFKAAFLNELAIHMMASDVDCVVRSYGGFFLQADGAVVGALVLERMGDDLGRFLKRHGSSLSIARRLSMCSRVLDILRYVRWGLRIVHNDLKSNNFLTAEAGGLIKLSDFGLAVNIQRGVGRFLDARPLPPPSHPIGKYMNVWTPRCWWRNAKACTAFVDESVDIFSVCFVLLEIIFTHAPSIVNHVRSSKALPPLDVLTHQCPFIPKECLVKLLSIFTPIVEEQVSLSDGIGKLHHLFRDTQLWESNGSEK